MTCLLPDGKSGAVVNTGAKTAQKLLHNQALSDVFSVIFTMDLPHRFSPNTFYMNDYISSSVSSDEKWPKAFPLDLL